MVFSGLRKRDEEGQVVEVLRELPQLKSYLQSEGNPI